MIRRVVVWGVVPLVAMAALSACGDEPVGNLVEGGPFPDADGVTFDGQFTFTTDEGIRAAYLEFDTLWTFNDSIDSQLRGVNLTTLNEDGSERAHVTSRQGTADARFEVLVARGEVVALVPSEGMRLETEHLVYDPREDRISGNSCFVLYQTGEPPRRGTSFTSDLNFRNFRLEDLGGCP